MPRKFYADLHCHPNCKAFYGGHPEPFHNIWDKIDHGYTDIGVTRYVRKTTPQIYKSSQAHLDACRAGNVRLLMISLYPIELGFFSMRNIPSIIMGTKTAEYIVEYIAGWHIKRLEAAKKKKYMYFDDLQKEYEYMLSQQGPSPDGQSFMRIAKNYNEIVEVTSDPDGICLVLSIEGGHVFNCGLPSTEKMDEDKLKAMIAENIAKVKAWEYPVFAINLAHHFWNQLCGHSTSFMNPVSQVIDQRKGKDKGITDLGRFVLKELLGRHNGRRIFIDTRHMSVQSRIEYFEFIDYHNSIYPEDKIPLITSHSGVNAYKTMKASMRRPDTNAKKKKGQFNRWGLNVSDEEILAIHRSEGIMGIMFDEGRLASDEALKNVKKLEDPARRRAEYAKLYWRNIFHIVEVVGDKSGWDIMCVGTDFDGGITHMEPYHDASHFPDFEQDMLQHLHKHETHKELWYDYTPEQLVRKIMQTNMMDFYKKHFQS